MGTTCSGRATRSLAASRAGTAQWNRLIGALDGQLATTGAFVAGKAFTPADVVVGLSVQRWGRSPIERPVLAKVAAYAERLSDRLGSHIWGIHGET